MASMPASPSRVLTITWRLSFSPALRRFCISPLAVALFFRKDRAGCLAAAERAGAEVLTLPIHPALPEAAARRIGEHVQEHLRRAGTGAARPGGLRP